MAGRGAGPVGGVLLRATARAGARRPDLVITSDPQPLDAVDYLPLFKYELVLAVSESNPLAGSKFVMPDQLADQTLITYPVDKQRLDVFTAFLDPADVEPAAIRKAELTPSSRSWSPATAARRRCRTGR